MVNLQKFVLTSWHQNRTIRYILTRPVIDQDRERTAAHEQAARRQQVAAGYSIADEIEKLDGLRTKGLSGPLKDPGSGRRVAAVSQEVGEFHRSRGLVLLDPPDHRLASVPIPLPPAPGNVHSPDTPCRFN